MAKTRYVSRTIQFYHARAGYLPYIGIKLSLAPIKLYRAALRALQEEVPTKGQDSRADAIINRESDRGSSPQRFKSNERGRRANQRQYAILYDWCVSFSDACARTTLSNNSRSQTRAPIHGNAASGTPGANSDVSGSDDIKDKFARTYMKFSQCRCTSDGLGRADSHMLPHTQALNMSSNKIEDQTNSHLLEVHFELEDSEDETEAFRPRITAICRLITMEKDFLQRTQ
ncbi:hypothetical protein FVEG_08509 [Fusarium verticillioides 7600]|uniref:Uncharacterized protein n=1 Tax=Gibberella moniliformis (strain M3125 / FGSC 7600) TaxID=334819 RepID=W7MWK0_GIBM7|nr:hypothetical protein FVEG_08509 [Fusarium verticillioides 7600]EWG48852.1 hypothetical protein FVEG_08509 [Fusarium verticillioides 7600]